MIRSQSSGCVRVFAFDICAFVKDFEYNNNNLKIFIPGCHFSFTNAI